MADTGTPRCRPEGRTGNGQRKTRILLVEDHPLMRKGVVSLIDCQPDLEVCAETEDAAQALEAVTDLEPDFVIVDISLGETSGISLIREIRGRDADLPVLVLSMHNEPLFVERALRAGASGYVTKQEDPSALLTAIRRILSGGVYVTESLGSAMLHGLVSAARGKRGSGVELLSDREFEVFGMVGRGLGTHQIAETLQRSAKTVQSHLENSKKKLGLKSVAELTRYAWLWTQQQSNE